MSLIVVSNKYKHIFSSSTLGKALDGDSDLLIAVGTTNPTKIAGIERAFKTFFPSEKVELIPCKVQTSIGAQPIGLDSIFIGAMQRAIYAKNSIRNCDFSVGVEAGIFMLGESWIDVQVAVIIDSRSRVGIGMSSGFPIPRKFVEEILRGGIELDVVVDKYFGTRDIGSHGGVIKLLTRDVVKREDLVYQAVINALIPWINEKLYFGSEK